MTSRRTKQQKKPRALVIWDFDRVFFHTDELNEDVAAFLESQGIPKEKFYKAYRTLRRTGATITYRKVLSALGSFGKKVSERRLQEERTRLLRSGRYFADEGKATLTFLRDQKVSQVLVSFSDPRFQKHKIVHGCGASFLRFFEEVVITKKDKDGIIRRILRKYPEGIPTFFIDDEEKHIRAIRESFPQIHAIHFRNMKLTNVQRTIKKRLRGES